MRKFLLAFCLMISYVGISQTYNNEWIDFNKTYYKFKVGSDGLYRITQPVLAGLGLANTGGNQFQLWRNGVQVPLFVTTNGSNTLSNTDYIEFWGVHNDGKPDNPLYRDPTFQISDKISLQTDTAAYFLTVEPNSSINLRFVNSINDVANNSLSPEVYFTHSLRFDFRDWINRGYAQNASQDLYSSSYDQGEFFSTNDIQIGTPYTFSYTSNMFIANVGIPAKLKVGWGGNSSVLYNQPRNLNLFVNNNLLLSSSFRNYQVNVDSNTNVPLSYFSGNDQYKFTVTNTTNAYDRMMACFVELNYPRTFDFGGASQFYFTLPSTSVGNYLEITDFFANGSIPVLYDLTNLKRYIANTSKSGVLKYALPVGGVRNFVLVSQNNNNINFVNNLSQKTFVNFTLTTNQADYLIISSSVLINDGPANNNGVNLYNIYRNSSSGGSFNSKVFDVDDLIDQFAFGIKKHPLGIRNFVRFANAQFVVKPKYVYFIGKACTYNQYRSNENSPYANILNIVPTFGWPASDVLLVSGGIDPIALVPVGRLSAISNQEVLDYLDKVKAYEQQADSSLPQTISNRNWMKQIVMINGADANDLGLKNAISSYFNGYTNLISGSSFGGSVNIFEKTTSGITTIENQALTNLFSSGFSLVNYFGHSASTTLGYNLDDPQNYQNTNKYPIFLVNGCDAGSYYDFDIGRFSAKTALAEKWVFYPQKGAIGFIASTHLGLTDNLNNFSTGFYQSLGNNGYNKGVAVNISDGQSKLRNGNTYFPDYFSRIHAEEMVLHGDPAIKIYSFSKPDFAIESADVVINPSFISVAKNSFTLKVSLHNIGKATEDSVNIQILRTLPDGSKKIINSQKKIIYYADSIIYNIAILPSEKGNNSITVFLDYDNKIDELSELNNTITKSFIIYEDDLTPIFPYNYSIIHNKTLTFSASTANPFSPNQQYVFELDTTNLFNSPLKISKTTSTSGGLVEFSNVTLPNSDSTVYYWRVGGVVSSGTIRWNNSSFLYLNESIEGFGQSHYYQHLQSNVQNIFLDTIARQWNYTPETALLHINHSIFPTSGHIPADFSLRINDNIITSDACIGHSIIFNLFDPTTIKPFYNQPNPSTTKYGGVYGYFMGSAASCENLYDGVETNFEFRYIDSTDRRKIRQFMDWIPNGVIVTARLILDDYYNVPYVNDWKNDPNIGNRMYDRFISAGFSALDSFTYPRTWAFVYRKNSSSFAPKWKFTNGLYDQLNLYASLPYTDSIGYISSPKFGPAANWKQLKWRGYSLDTKSGDLPQISIYGINNNGTDSLFYIINPSQTDFDISGINASRFPFIKLTMRNSDSLNYTPYQLRYWRLIADPVPEGAIAPNIKYLFGNGNDTLEAGQQINFALAFKNISNIKFRDSILVKMQVTDKSNNTIDIPIRSQKPVLAGDTTIVSATIETKNLTGSNSLFVNLNPYYAQPESYLLNNFIYKNFYVKYDTKNPLLDVTFDGVHILNSDIVSAKPHIHIRLKDESKYLALDDTSLVSIKLQYPDPSGIGQGTVRQYRYGSDTLRFIPANLKTGDNSAYVEFTPTLPLDGVYKLTVQGNDRNNNLSGSVEYSVNFKVQNKPTISNVFNYPNPFTSSTAFVFTITGSEEPQNLRIQILTITGKIVKEITKQELGPIHIGRNITEYKWNGTDMYGQKLGNGVYLYRVITNLNGKSSDKLNITDEHGSSINSDQYFKSGYGKMYLMR